MNTNIIMQALNPKVRPYIVPSIKGSENKVSYPLFIILIYKYKSIYLIKYRRDVKFSK